MRNPHRQSLRKDASVFCHDGSSRSLVSVNKAAVWFWEQIPCNEPLNLAKITCKSLRWRTTSVLNKNNITSLNVQLLFAWGGALCVLSNSDGDCKSYINIDPYIWSYIWFPSIVIQSEEAPAVAWCYMLCPILPCLQFFSLCKTTNNEKLPQKQNTTYSM